MEKGSERDKHYALATPFSNGRKHLLIILLSEFYGTSLAAFHISLWHEVNHNITGHSILRERSSRIRYTDHALFSRTLNVVVLKSSGTAIRTLDPL